MNMAALWEFLTSPLSRIFTSLYASFYNDLVKIFPPELLPSPDSTVSVLGISIPTFLVYFWLAGDD